ncbi:MAG: AarF/ABC1/UbiB kinase family protein [Planctomycetota bacterium]
MQSPAAIGQTFRNAARAQQIVTVGIRFGFGDVMAKTGLSRLFTEGLKLVGAVKPDADAKSLPQPVRVRKALEALGPTFIKIGQVLATRPDLIPESWADEFTRLQDDVPPADPDKIREALDREFPQGVDEAFATFDYEPLAAGSIAQVHAATLADGSEVVVKVLRPGIRAMIESDMQLLAGLAEFVEEHFTDLGYSPTQVVEAFSSELQREVDLSHEARACERLRRAFSDNPKVDFPKIFASLSSESVVTMERVRGTPLSKLNAGDRPAEQMEAIVRAGADAVFRQTLEIGFFHADPHPGNLFATDDGAVVFIDCGMTGHVEPATQEALAELVQGVIEGNVDRVIDVVTALAEADPGIYRNRLFRADVFDFIGRFQDISISELNMAELLEDFFAKVRKHHMRVPADLVFLIKALTTIQGVGEKLAPDFEIVEHVRPYVEKLVRQRYGPEAIIGRARRAATNYSRFFEDLPLQLRSLLFDVKQSKVTVNLEHRNLDELIRTLDVSVTTVANALIVSAVIVGSSVLLLAAASSDWLWAKAVLIVLAGGGYLAGAALGLIKLATSWISRRRSRL